METDLATAAQIVPTAAAAATAAAVSTAESVAEPITGWHALTGLPIGVLHGLAPGTDLEIAVEAVLEQTSDLAVADRVAWVIARRTGRQHVVLTTDGGYLVAALTVDLDWAASMRLQPASYAPTIVSVACEEGVLPVLRRIAA